MSCLDSTLLNFVLLKFVAIHVKATFARPRLNEARIAASISIPCSVFGTGI